MGHQHLRCLRQSPKGARRWYAGCCRTPIANGLESARFAFTGLVRPFLRFESDAARDAALGPIRGAVLPKAARGTPLHPEASPLVFGRAILRILWGSVRGEHRPSPFFDSRGQPVRVPELMDLATRRRLQGEVRAATSRPDPAARGPRP